jgi:hypothetical protein
MWEFDAFRRSGAHHGRDARHAAPSEGVENEVPRVRVMQDVRDDSLGWNFGVKGMGAIDRAGLADFGIFANGSRK